LQGLAIINLKKVTFRDRIIVTGRVAPCAQSFAVNLGQNDSNYVIHFNPRFNESNGVIVCNSMINGGWSNEMRIYQFPFQQGAEAKMSFLFEGKKVKVRIPDEIIFMSNLNLDYIEYISVVGDFIVHSIRME
ncbi:galectin-1-like, partial [Heteronotia binoei]|uniref:galectin-1-like n=1 Tax=Heteronotia binoei TaxID=13085 RepID=UPI002931799B